MILCSRRRCLSAPTAMTVLSSDNGFRRSCRPRADRARRLMVRAGIMITAASGSFREFGEGLLPSAFGSQMSRRTGSDGRSDPGERRFRALDGVDPISSSSESLSELRTWPHRLRPECASRRTWYRP
jgi:hypothetical protein